MKKIDLADLVFPYHLAIQGNKGKAQHVLNAKIASLTKDGLVEEAELLKTFRLGLKKKRL